MSHFPVIKVQVYLLTLHIPHACVAYAPRRHNNLSGQHISLSPLFLLQPGHKSFPLSASAIRSTVQPCNVQPGPRWRAPGLMWRPASAGRWDGRPPQPGWRGKHRSLIRPVFQWAERKSGSAVQTCLRSPWNSQNNNGALSVFEKQQRYGSMFLLVNTSSLLLIVSWILITGSSGVTSSESNHFNMISSSFMFRLYLVSTVSWTLPVIQPSTSHLCLPGSRERSLLDVFWHSLSLFSFSTTDSYVFFTPSRKPSHGSLCQMRTSVDLWEVEDEIKTTCRSNTLYTLSVSSAGFQLRDKHKKSAKLLEILSWNEPVKTRTGDSGSR